MFYRLTLLLIAIIFGSSVAIEAQEEETYPNAHLLVEVDWLADEDMQSIRIIDMRDASAYAEGHIPGAVNIPVSSISSTINSVAMEFDREEVQSAINEIGLTPDTTVVIYDNLGMMNSARMFWTLEYIGHDDARILNGGWNAWVAADKETTTDQPEIEVTEYPINLQRDKLVTAEEINHRLMDDHTTIIDARSPEEYRGEVTFSERAGHIPGAILFTWLDALTGGDAVMAIESDWREQLRDDDVERFRTYDELRTLLDDLNIPEDNAIITYCQTFWRGAHVYFLMRLMGYEDVKAYDGSWSEWGNSTEFPVVTGPEPYDESETDDGS